MFMISIIQFFKFFLFFRLFFFPLPLFYTEISSNPIFLFKSQLNKENVSKSVLCSTKEILGNLTEHSNVKY